MRRLYYSVYVIRLRLVLAVFARFNKIFYASRQSKLLSVASFNGHQRRNSDHPLTIFNLWEIINRRTVNASFINFEFELST